MSHPVEYYFCWFTDVNMLIWYVTYWLFKVKMLFFIDFVYVQICLNI